MSRFVHLVAIVLVRSFTRSLYFLKQVMWRFHPMSLFVNVVALVLEVCKTCWNMSFVGCLFLWPFVALVLVPLVYGDFEPIEVLNESCMEIFTWPDGSLILAVVHSKRPIRNLHGLLVSFQNVWRGPFPGTYVLAYASWWNGRYGTMVFPTLRWL